MLAIKWNFRETYSARSKYFKVKKFILPASELKDI